MKSNSSIPWIEQEYENHVFDFEKIKSVSSDIPIAASCYLNSKMLLNAYRNGVFPWSGPYQPILWWRPEPRMTLDPTKVRVSKSLKKYIKRYLKNGLSISSNRCFRTVILACAETRERSNGTWITNDIISAYMELNKMGYQPFIVYAKIHRIKIDLNRSLQTSHCEDDTSNELWQLFHDQIFTFRQEIINNYNRGLLIDIHGHGHPIQRIELGYLITSQKLRELSGDETFIQHNETSINSLIENHPENKKLSDLLFGDNALGSLLSKNGFPTVPSSTDRAPKSGEPFFSGGTNTKNYGSKYQNGVDAIQLELNRNGLRQDSEDRERFSKVFAKILIDYMKFHYSDIFPSN
mgnify:CR=1 FL=1